MGQSGPWTNSNESENMLLIVLWFLWEIGLYGMELLVACLLVLNSVFFLLVGYPTKAKEASFPYYFLIAGKEEMNLCLFTGELADYKTA